MNNTKLTRDDWINAAMMQLSTGGIDLVRVDSLAKKLEITRGSFYYHFGNRQDLLKAILDKWRLSATEAVIEGLNSRELTAQDRLLALMMLPLRGGKSFDAASVELSLRAWARRDDMARSAVEEVDSYRIKYLEGIFLEMNHSASQSSDLSYLVYSYMMATSILTTGNSRSDQADRAKRLTNFLADVCPISECQHRIA
ncbi:MAG: TetR/AcrR family transcriptional regulator [Gammaproteobacteria bacterium]|jgi:AcrR family transcriptional regulator|uniref:TetR/AcrR family transcriptional regulator n=1 Tax=Marinomonas TaxID=28253 RepID=UPI000C1E2DD2|nr:MULTISPECIES: TetR/AcrR family transcriptional regulator [unclassified Marinomonas]MBU1296853.1 TetR/AcrR family transcriptional regulator [Gammaproteobacteria bacterium]MBU1467000.1 TetR/AcrR family transcriptional regulator [Gammaproteobacteria bacterium]MBU2021148.1 TetR/AcrR family transcriptional regulator [Gammaproteobacteria bacterium]MBU2237241.1 TetR/AcrR family transcriptional regulator [Gammaproteobacteria bacterium]MBU2320291.1 TetR/AcrR family transcriptional regulator [Gammapr